MVDYQQFVSLAFEVSREKGAVIASLNESQDVLAVAAKLWSENPELKQMSAGQARNFLQQNIEVQ